jgi:hypothetical protein
MVALAPSVNVLFALVCRNLLRDYPPTDLPGVQGKNNKRGRSRSMLDAFLNHVHRSGPSAMCGPGNVSTFTCATGHSKLDAAVPGTRMLQYNTETTLQPCSSPTHKQQNGHIETFCSLVRSLPVSVAERLIDNHGTAIRLDTGFAIRCL